MDGPSHPCVAPHVGHLSDNPTRWVIQESIERTSQHARCQHAASSGSPLTVDAIRSSEKQKEHQRRRFVDQSFSRRCWPAKDTRRRGTSTTGVCLYSVPGSTPASAATRSACRPSSTDECEQPTALANARMSGSRCRAASRDSTPCGGSPARVRRRRGSGITRARTPLAVSAPFPSGASCVRCPLQQLRLERKLGQVWAYVLPKGAPSARMGRGMGHPRLEAMW